MKKIIFITALFLLSINNQLFSEVTGWVDISNNSFQNYEMKGFYFGKTTSFQNYSTMFTYGVNESDETSKLAYSYYGGNGWTFYNNPISGVINNVSISYAGTVGDYSFYGTNGTIIIGNIGGWSQLSFANAPEYADLDYVAGAFYPQSGYGLPPKGTFSDGSSLYYTYGQKAGPNITQYVVKVDMETTIEGITDIIYGGGEIFYAIGKGGQIFKSSNIGQEWELVSSLAGVNFEDIIFIDDNFSSMLITATDSTDPTTAYIYTSTDGGVTVERQSTITGVGVLKELNYVEKEDAYYVLCSDESVLKIAGDYSTHETVDLDLPETENDLTGFAITNRLVRYAGDSAGGIQAYLPETKAIIEVIPSEEFEHVFTFRDLSEGFISSNKWDVEGANITTSTNVMSLKDVSFNATGSFKIYLTANLYTTSKGPAGNVTLHKDSIVVNPVTYFEWELVANSTSNTISEIVFPGNQNMIGYYGLDGGTHSGYVTKTVDGGETWTRSLETSAETEDEPAKSVKGITSISFPSVEIGYAGTYCGSGWLNGKQVFYAPGLWKTVNGGEKWTAVDLSAFNEIFSLKSHSVNAIHFFNENEGVVVMGDLILYTNDGGTTWIQSEGVSLEEDETLEMSKLSYVNDSLLYGLGTNQRIFKSTDKGKTWEKVVSLTEKTTANLNNISFHGPDFGIVVANTATDGVLVTEDGGTTWEVYNSGNNNIMKTVHIANDTLVFIGGANEAFMKSLDKGKTWTNINQPLIAMDYLTITTTATGVGYAAGSKSGLKRYVPELAVDFEMIVDNDSTFVDFTNRSVGFITGYKWEVNEEVVSENSNLDGFALERPNISNLYTITLTIEDKEEKTASLTKTIEVTRDPIQPEKSINPTPAKDAVLTVPEIDFAWENNSTTEGGEIKYNVYFGTSENSMELLKENLGEKTFSHTVATPTSNTVYYWRVDTKNDEASTEGDVWSFTVEGVSIADAEVYSEILVLPSLFTDRFVIQLPTTKRSNVEVRLNDLQGRTVYSRTVEAESNVEVSGLGMLSSGIYTCTVKFDHVTKTVKVIKK